MNSGGYSSDEKHVSPAASSVEPVEAGQVTKRRMFNFNLQVRQEESSFATTKGASNADFDPIPPSKRTWGWGAYVAYWMADAWAVSNWEVGELLKCFILDCSAVLRLCSFFHDLSRA